MNSNQAGLGYFRSAVKVFTLGCGWAMILWMVGSSADAQTRIDFSSQIKPILSDNCFACHGPDPAERATDFRLDQKESALDPNHSVIVPQDRESSLLVQRILSEDPDEAMPPAEYRKQLTDKQKQLLVQWIDEGASWSEHWAFQTPVRRPLPETSDREWPINFVDHYVLQRLEQKGLVPSPETDEITLLRRVSFDLTGLPPTPEQVSQYRERIAADGLDAAYRQTVEQLLASPHFGERLAVYWLDLVRYADTVGYHGDQNVSVSPYRDYVIDSFNHNLPFDQFTREQLAGDLLENPTQTQLIASGYNRLGMMSAEGGVQPEEYLNKYASDRVRTTASVWLGITLGCAECHDHKFDPFSSKEFYEFSAFFADIKEQGLYSGASQSGKWGPSVDVADDELAALVAPIDAQIEKLKSTIVETETIAAARESWEAALHAAAIDWNVLTPNEVVTLPDLKTKIDSDHAVLVEGDNPETAIYAVTVDVDPTTRAFRLEALPHPALPQQGPGRSSGGNFVVSELIVFRGDATGDLEMAVQDSKQWSEDLRSRRIELVNASASFEQTQGAESHPDKKWSAASAIDDDEHGASWGWAILPEVGKSHELVVELGTNQEVAEQVTFLIRQQHQNGPHSLGHFRLSETSAGSVRASQLVKLPDPIQAVLATEPGQRSPTQNKTLSEFYMSISPAFESQREEIAALEKNRAALVKQHTRSTLITVSVSPRPIRVLARGDWMDKSGELVQPSVPSALSDAKWEPRANDGRANRLDLAEWIVDPKNPLTSRVFVNRIWRMLFGHGISNVLDDLGSQGEPPSHPELLDHLAISFVESGWDIKQLIRTMVLSKTYRQSSSLRNDLKEIDPENRLLARQARFRLDAEFIRDHALAVSGLLVDKSGGRSVMPYQPAGLYRHLNFPTRKYQPSSGESQYRRGLYTHWQRQFLHPAMKTFDAPAREECTAARPRSSTPLAALVLLNDPSYVESARVLAEGVVAQYGSTSTRLDAIFERAFSRVATVDEKKILEELLQSQLSYFATHREEATQLLSIGQPSSGESERELEESSTLAERAAWTSVCRAVINMHEFVLRK